MTDQRTIEPKITERIRDFDVSALLALLAEIAPPGNPYEVRFAGHPARSPMTSWLEEIQFETRDAATIAKVAANLGLLSCRSPLPDYFRKLFEEAETRLPLQELLALLDDRLLERRFSSYAPERDPSIFPSFQETTLDVLCLGALRSPASLHWLFHKLYPELLVHVVRAPADHTMPTDDARLGAATLSLTALGGQARVPVRAVEVQLFCEEHLSHLLDETDARRPWLDVARERLVQQVFPILRGTGAHLTVWLVLSTRARAKLLREPFPGPSYIGYDPLVGRHRLRFRRRLTLRAGSARLCLPREVRFRPLGRTPGVLAKCRIKKPLFPLPPARVRLYSGPIPSAEDEGSGGLL